jgi:hypothetical protein
LKKYAEETFLLLNMAAGPKHGQLHREYDRPAIEYLNGYKAWYRLANTTAQVNGDRVLYSNGKLHREIYPANRWKSVNSKMLSNENASEKTGDSTEKIYFWWIQRFYDMSRPCGHKGILIKEKF